MSIPTDDRFINQWYLDNASPGGLDLNLVEVWDDYTGAGVTVTVIDDGFDYNHTDLAPNYLLGSDYDFGSGDDDAAPVAAGNNHGTAVIGIIGAARNGTGVVGVSYDADLVGFRTDLSLGATLNAINATADSAAANFVATDVVSMSFGTTGTFRVSTEDTGMVAGFALGSADGRGGLGTVYVKSAGNDRGTDDTNAEMRDATPFTITVAAALEDGSVTTYSTPGASVLVTAFGSPSSGTIETTDRVGAPGYSATDFTSSFNGTSAAAPMVSGVVALMLEANPDLGWRDVQTILAHSSRQVGSEVEAAASGSEQFSGARGTTASWVWNDAGNWNGGGMHFSNDYGFGLVDTKAAVRLAETWDLQSTSANRAETSVDVLDTATTITASGSNSFNGEETDDILIEHVVVEMNFLALDNKGDLEVYLTSPGGTTSKLIAGIGGTGGFTGRWEFGSNAFRGETSAGTWSITVHDNDGAGAVQVDDIVIRTYGSAASEDDLFVFTKEFSDYAGVAGHATAIVGGAGVNTINAAAVDAGSTIDLQAGTGTIDGVTVTLSDIDRVYTGDGTDFVTASDRPGQFVDAGRGGDFVVVAAVTAGSHYDGGDGTDLISFGASSQADGVYDLGAGTATVGAAVATLANVETFLGTAQADTILGSSGTDTLKGGGGDDVIHDGSGGDAVLGEGGNDRIVMGDSLFNGDSYDGGEGIDTFDAAHFNWATDVTIDLTAGQWSFVAGSEAVTNFENIEGADGITGTIETLIGNDVANVIDGNGGDDVIEGRGGDDVLIGGIGADTLTGGDGVDTADYSDSAASVTVDLVAGTGTGGDAGGDTLSEIENVVGSAEADVLTGDGGANRLEGGGGGDVIDDRGGADTVLGEGGNDRIVMGDAAINGDSYDGGEGIDTIDAAHFDWGTNVTIDLTAGQWSYFAGSEAVTNFENIEGADDSFGVIETLIGNAVANVIDGNGGDDVIEGRGGDDVLIGGTGADALVGGAGVDTAGYSGSAGRVTVSLTSGTGSHGEAAGDTLIGMENVVGSAFDDTLKGNSIANRLEGGDGDDRLDGQGGDDVMVGGTGADRHVGGWGIDTADYSGAAGRVTVSLIASTGSYGDAAGDVLFGMENVVGSAFDDTLKGDNVVNRLEGGDGDDRLDGQGGDDVLAGGAGADRLVGAAGIDTADYSGAAGRVTVSLTSGTGSYGEAAGDTLTGIENLVGSAFDDTLKGDSLANRLEGGDGDDRLDGQGGDDVLVGGAGADRHVGGWGIDTADYSGAAGRVTVSLIASTGSYGEAAGDALFGMENVTGSAFDDTLKGDNVVNRLEGRDGDDRLDGQGGDDVLVGGVGDDRQTGGGGSDIFVFGNGVGDDTITDFVAGAGTPDAIDLSANSLLNGFADILAQSSQSGLDTLINLGGGDLLTLLGVTRTSLHQDDFVF